MCAWFFEHGERALLSVDVVSSVRQPREPTQPNYQPFAAVSTLINSSLSSTPPTILSTEDQALDVTASTTSLATIILLKNRHHALLPFIKDRTKPTDTT